MGALNLRNFWIFLFLIFTISCTFTQIKEKDQTTVPSISASFQEKKQLASLQKALLRWEEEIDSIISSLQGEIDKTNVFSQDGLSAREKTFLLQKREDLASYLETLKKIKILQQNLKAESNALAREPYYFDLMDNYLESLKKIEILTKKEYFFGIDLQRLEEDIVTNYQAKNFYHVIELYDQLIKNGKGKEIPVKCKASYALALAGLDREDDTQKVIERILNQSFLIDSENSPFVFELGEWLINKGKTALAQNFFQKLNTFYENETLWHRKVKEKLVLFENIPQTIIVNNKIDQARFLYDQNGNFLNAYQLGLEAQRECMELACQNEVQTFLNQLINQAKTFLGKSFFEIDQNIKLGKYSEALQLLISLKRYFPSGSYPPSLQEDLALISAKEEFLKSKQGAIADETIKQKFERADSLLESERYDEAIDLFEKLTNSSYGAEATEKKQVAINGLARTRRLKAGQMFLQAKGTQNLELKKNYLIESYTLLKSIMEKYPNNSYAEKINKNLLDVRLEIEKFYPEFFSEGKTQSPK